MDYCNDSVTRTTSWLGKIGLMYPSDYGYATKGGDTLNRTTCLQNILNNWQSNYDCYKNNWLYNVTKHQWTITPVSSSYASSVFIINVTGGINGNGDAGSALNISPALYLKTDTKINSGKGSKEMPYQLNID